MANDTKTSNQPNISETRSLTPIAGVSPNDSDPKGSTATQKTTVNAHEKAETTLPLDSKHRQEVSHQLDDAIDELEALLKEREGDFLHPLGTMPRPTQAGNQYAIPLDDKTHGSEPDSITSKLDLPLLTTPEWEANAEKISRFQPILDRLANELEVIIQTGVDEALKIANQKIMHRVHNHVAIVLPEILEEIEHEQNREMKFSEDP